MVSGDRLSEEGLRRDMTVGIGQSNADNPFRGEIKPGKRNILFDLRIVSMFYNIVLISERRNILSSLGRELDSMRVKVGIR